MRYIVSLAPHFHDLYSSLELCSEGPWFTCIQEDGCDKGVHQMYLGTDRNTPVIPNWFQACQCCCCLCYPDEYLWLGTLISYNWAQVLEARDCLKLWLSQASVHLISVLMPLALSSAWSSQHWSPCRRLRRLCRDTKLILPVLPLLLGHRCHQQSRN